MATTVNINRMEVVMRCYDKLPIHLREWISTLSFSLHDDHILRGIEEVEACKKYIENGGEPYYMPGNNQN